MSLRINEMWIRCDVTGEYAESTLDGWTVTWLPDRFFTQNEAITALTLVEIYFSRPEPGDPVWYEARAYEEELGLDERHRP